MINESQIVYLIERIKEPGTHRALLYVSGLFSVPGVHVDGILSVLVLIFTAAAVFLPEGKVKDELATVTAPE
jgi:hypothetical protein